MAKHEGRTIGKTLVVKALASQGITLERDFKAQQWKLSNGLKFSSLQDIANWIVESRKLGGKKPAPAEQVENQEPAEVREVT